MKHAVAAASVVLALASGRPAHGQIADPKTAFVERVARFGAAPDRASLDAMSRALEQWDTSLRSSEALFAANLPGSGSLAAARMHVAIGAAFLDRGRVQDALREFTGGAALDPGRADTFTFQGVAYDQLLRDFDQAAVAYSRAAALDPLGPARAYLAARALDKAGKRDEALARYRTVLQLWRRDATGHAPIAVDTPFIQLGLVQEQPGAEPFFPPAPYAEGFALLQHGLKRLTTELQIKKDRDGMCQNLANQAMLVMPKIACPNACDTESFGQLRANGLDDFAPTRAGFPPGSAACPRTVSG